MPRTRSHSMPYSTPYPYIPTSLYTHPSVPFCVSPTINYCQSDASSSPPPSPPHSITPRPLSPPPQQPSRPPPPPPLIPRNNYPKLYILDGDTAAGLAIRYFIHERGGVRVRAGFIDVQLKDQILPSFIWEQDHAGELPMLFLDNPTRRPVRKVVGFEAITEYIDSVSPTDRYLYGNTEQERALIRSCIHCLRRDVVEPLYEWNNHYLGNKTGEEVTGYAPVPGRRRALQERIEMTLDQVEENLEGLEYLLGKFCAADVYLFGMVVAHADRWPWFFDDERRPRISDYFARMSERPMAHLADEFWDTTRTTVVD
ncbi:hypothetical protein AtubIFM54640_006407 [Aspergillus tubingensis]|uniref:glutathione S-transferase family protein n=1 Tax=Aspergillus tubingensis TaxID=5068 RepID=UPI00157914A9|nr:uncharacterized protein AtWU_01175 [Aspergillus tubingensis]GFN11379.1 hypothetical protein AtWU_01175 [Aspergillus tubingensis]GLA64683.1 hypothetical protein AtubIFM54640_006407 [Aspergillus tubingensis]GLB21482.1 hypothetical protein AtubIFM61612_002030 [Aspergillus tubingensis]